MSRCKARRSGSASAAFVACWRAVARIASASSTVVAIWCRPVFAYAVQAACAAACPGSPAPQAARVAATMRTDPAAGRRANDTGADHAAGRTRCLGGSAADVDLRPPLRVGLGLAQDLAHHRRRVAAAEQQVAEQVADRIALGPLEVAVRD